MVAELDVLLDVIAGAVGGNARFGLASRQLVDGHTQGVAHQVPKRQIDAALPVFPGSGMKSDRVGLYSG